MVVWTGSYGYGVLALVVAWMGFVWPKGLGSVRLVVREWLTFGIDVRSCGRYGLCRTLLSGIAVRGFLRCLYCEPEEGG